MTKSIGFAEYSVFPVLLVVLTVRNRDQLAAAATAIFVLGVSWVALVLGMAIAKGNLNLYVTGPGAIFGGANETAGGIGSRAAQVALVGLGISLSRRAAWRRYVAGAALAVAALVLSGHRGSLFSFGVALVVLWLASSNTTNRTRTRARLGWAALALAITTWWAWASAPAFVTARYRDPLESASFEGRLAAQQLALQGWSEAPVLGRGTGSSAFLIAGSDQPRFGAVRGLYPHNVLIELLAEVGIVGAGIYVVVFVGLFLSAYRALRVRAPDDWVMPVLLALCVQSFVLSQGGADLTIHNDLWIFGSLLAVALAQPRVSRSAATSGDFAAHAPPSVQQAASVGDLR